MSIDVREMLRTTAPTPSTPIDLDEVRSRLDQRHRRRIAIRSFAIAVAIVAATSIVVVRAETGDQGVQVTRPAASPTKVIFDPQGDSVDLPSGWQVTDRRLTPELADPHDILAISTMPISAGSTDAVCVANWPPATALAAMKDTDAFVWITEWDTSGTFRYAPDIGHPTPANQPARPARFTSDGLEPLDCVRRAFSNLTGGSYSFTDQGRVFNVFVVVGDNISTERARALYSALDSLHFVRA